MKVVMIGGGSGFAAALLDSLYLQGHTVYWVSPDPPENVPSFDLQATHFPLHADDPKVSDVLDHVRPDAAIYLGAYDGSLWRPCDTASGQRLLRELSHLLLLDYFTVRAGAGEPPRFVFLSCEAVFDSGGEAVFDEQAPPCPASQKGRYLAAAEQMMRALTADTRRDAMILRIGTVFGSQLPAGSPPDDYIQMMINQALTAGRIAVPRGMWRRPVHITDAVGGICAVLASDTLRGGLYHITGNEDIGDEDAARRIMDRVPGCSLLLESGGVKVRMSGDAIRQAVGFAAQRSFADGLTETLQWAQSAPAARARQQSAARRGSKNTPRGHAWSDRPVIRMLRHLAILAVCAAGLYWVRGQPRLTGLDFMLLYVVAVASLLGKGHAFVSVGLALLIPVAMQHWQPLAVEAFTQLDILLRGTVLMIAGTLAGAARDRATLTARLAQDAIDAQRLQLELLETASRATHAESAPIRPEDPTAEATRVLSTLQALQAADVRQVLQNVLLLLQHDLQTDRVAAYRLSPRRDYAHLAVATAAPRPLGKTIALADAAWAQTLLVEGQPHATQQDASGRSHVIVPLLLDAATEYIIVVGDCARGAVESIVRRITPLMQLIAFSAKDAQAHAKAMRPGLYLPGTDILRPEPFLDALMLEEAATGRAYTLLALREEPLTAELPRLSAQLHALIRNTDAIGLQSSGILCILLRDTEPADAAVVVARLHRAGHIVQILPSP